MEAITEQEVKKITGKVSGVSVAGNLFLSLFKILAGIHQNRSLGVAPTSVPSPFAFRSTTPSNRAAAFVVQRPNPA